MTNCCPPDHTQHDHHDHDSAHGDKHIPAHTSHSGGSQTDWLLVTSSALIGAGYLFYFAAPEQAMAIRYLGVFAHTMFELLNTTWWSLLLGIIFVGLLGVIPREFITSIFGHGGTLKGVVRATLAGVLLDVCSHGILMVGMKLYERGASIGQTMAFLIASPWNSLSLTLILLALIGWKFTLIFIVFSMIIAVISGVIFEQLVRRGALPANPHSFALPADFAFFPEFRKLFQRQKFSLAGAAGMMKNGFLDSRMVLRWIFFGFALTGLIRTFVPVDTFQSFFGPSLLGLALTLVVATILEVCSEGSTPIAADLVTRAGAPGNAFTFLMAGVATDYTEIMTLKGTTRSWKIALFLPLVTVPQVVLLGWLLNQTW